ncbi:unnamed protein product [Rotaria sp. Silwood2]|nr:unnamed protein product [Rotaria sp. Silwood2]
MAEGTRLRTQFYKVLKNKECSKMFRKHEFGQNLKYALVEQFPINIQIMEGSNDSNDENVAYTIIISGSQMLQIEFLLCIHQNTLKQLEEQHEDVRIFECIKDGYFISPKKFHDSIKELLQNLAANCQRTQFTIKEICFSSVAAAEEQQLIEVALAHNCLVQTKIDSTNTSYTFPVSCLSKENAEVVPAAMSIDIRIGDLATQTVDIVVVCSTSQHLMNDICKKAGKAVADEVNAATQTGKIMSEGYETVGGNLFCQKLFFLPWTTQKLDDITLRRSIQNFFQTAIHHTVNTGRTSLAFPALGCGELNYDPSTIAEIILDETQIYANYNLQILIVLLPEKTENYKAFCFKLAELRQKKSVNNPTNFIYPHSIVQMTLTGLEQDIKESWKLIQNHVNKCVLTVECDEFPFYTWNQKTIDSFYKFCLERQILPEVNRLNDKLKLLGPKEEVKEAQIEFYRLKSVKAEEARIASYARVAVWLLEIENNTFEKYSLKLNALFETALELNNEVFAGVAYGVGVYFSTNASYSHDYTSVSPTTHRRCMFLAKVLVGKAAPGNKNMRIPPAGYDSTTDNNHIFVTYHDDQAYAAYLITYKSPGN